MESLFYINISGIDVKHDGLMWSKKIINMITQREKRNANQIGTEITLNTDSFNYQFILRPNYVVAGIRKNSPAEKAGVKVGDAILKINGKSVADMTLTTLNTRLQKATNHDLKLLLKRDGKEIALRFRVVDPIPFIE